MKIKNVATVGGDRHNYGIMIGGERVSEYQANWSAGLHMFRVVNESIDPSIHLAAGDSESMSAP